MKTYFNKTLGISVTASSKQEAIHKIVSGINAKITIDTGIKKPLDVKGVEILNQVLRDMPSSKTNGVTLKSVRGKVILEIDPKKNEYFADDLDKSLFHLAKNLKRIVKKSCDWARKGKEVVKQLSNKGKATLVSDCYQLYDILMDRNVGKFTYAKANKIIASGNEEVSDEDFKKCLEEISKKYKAKLETKKIGEGFQHWLKFDSKFETESLGKIFVIENTNSNYFVINCWCHGKRIPNVVVHSKNACLKYVNSFCERITKSR